MSVFRADLTATHDRLIAHLLPGDVVIVQTSHGERTIGFEFDWLAWHAIYDDAEGLRVCRFGSERALVENTRVRHRAPVVAAARWVRRGGAVYVVCEWRQERNRFGEAYGPLVRLPAGHVAIEADVAVSV